jgi:hypothetical protein
MAGNDPGRKTAEHSLNIIHEAGLRATYVGQYGVRFQCGTNLLKNRPGCPDWYSQYNQIGTPHGIRHRRGRVIDHAQLFAKLAHG